MISIMLPAYQEAENLKMILPRLRKVMDALPEACEILVVDTMEPMDDAEAVCAQNGATYIHREGGNLYGDAMKTGFAKAQGTYVVVMDADGSHNPEDILRFYQEMKTGKYDLIIGSRYCKGGYTENNFILRFMSWVLNVTYRVFFGLRVKDVSDSFRMYKGAQLKSLRLECDNFDIVEEILIKLNYTIPGFSIKEVPISFNKRAMGKSKRNLLLFIRSYIHTIARLMRIKTSVHNKSKRSTEK